MDDARPDTLSTADRAPDLAEVLRWHGGWAAALALAALLLWLTAPWTRGTGLALALGAAPAVGLLIARNYDGPRLRTGLVIAWALAGAAAATLTGGLASPLAVWCLAPMVAAHLIGGLIACPRARPWRCWRLRGPRWPRRSAWPARSPRAPWASVSASPAWPPPRWARPPP